MPESANFADFVLSTYFNDVPSFFQLKCFLSWLVDALIVKMLISYKLKVK